MVLEQKKLQVIMKLDMDNVRREFLDLQNKLFQGYRGF